MTAAEVETIGWVTNRTAEGLVIAYLPELVIYEVLKDALQVAETTELAVSFVWEKWQRPLFVTVTKDSGFKKIYERMLNAAAGVCDLRVGP